MQSNVEIAREYVKAIENGATGDALARFFTSDVVIQEMPSRVAPNGSTSDLARALQGAERGKQLFQRQIYTITNMVSEGGHVALEMDWIGITAVPVQDLPPGSEMRDHVAVFLQFRGGCILANTLMTVSSLGDAPSGMEPIDVEKPCSRQSSDLRA